jgi:hypothetical protein
MIKLNITPNNPDQNLIKNTKNNLKYTKI